MSLALPDDVRRHHQEILDLSGVIQFSLIHALELSAKTNGYKIKQKPDDGWYLFNGSIDTYLISEAIEQAVREKIRFDAKAAA